MWNVQSCVVNKYTESSSAQISTSSHHQIAQVSFENIFTMSIQRKFSHWQSKPFSPMNKSKLKWGAMFIWEIQINPVKARWQPDIMSVSIEIVLHGVILQQERAEERQRETKEQRRGGETIIKFGIIWFKNVFFVEGVGSL